MVVVRGAAAGVAVVVVVHLRWWGLEIAGASLGLPNCQSVDYWCCWHSKIADHEGGGGWLVAEAGSGEEIIQNSQNILV